MKTCWCCKQECRAGNKTRLINQNDVTLAEYPTCLVGTGVGHCLFSGAVFPFWPVVVPSDHEYVGGTVHWGRGVLMALAVIEMRRHRTTVIPHREADHLVTTGVFKWTLNPIYLGDTLVLLGFILHWDAVLSLAILPIFITAIDYEFTAPEEDRLRRKFRSDFERYTRGTRRWI